MAVEDSDSNFGTTVRAFTFNGDDTKFRSWEGKTLALASSKGFMLALTRGETAPGLRPNLSEGPFVPEIDTNNNENT